MDRVLNHPDIIRKIVDDDNASNMSVVSRTGRDNVRRVELEDLLEYIQGGEMLLNFPVIWPSQVCKERTFQTEDLETCVTILDESFYRHEMEIVPYANNDGEFQGVAMSVISSEINEEDGLGRKFDILPLIRSKRMLKQIIKSNCWSPDFYGKQMLDVDIQMKTYTPYGILDPELTWEFLTEFMEKVAYNRRLFELTWVRCEIFAEQIFFTFDIYRRGRWRPYTGRMTYDSDGITMIITIEEESETIILSKFFSVGRIVQIFYERAWERIDEPVYPGDVSISYEGAARITRDPSERVTHEFKTQRLTAADLDLEDLLRYVYEEGWRDSAIVGLKYLFCDEYTQHIPMDRTYAMLLYRGTEDANLRVYRHSVRFLIRLNKQGAFLGVELRIVSSRSDEEDWAGSTFHVRSLITSKSMLEQILGSRCWHPAFNGRQDSSLNVEKLTGSQVGEIEDMDWTWRYLCYFMISCNNTRCFFNSVLTNFRSYISGDKITFTFTVGSWRVNRGKGNGLIVRNANGMTLTLTSESGESKTFSRILSVGRVLHLVANEYLMRTPF